MVLGEFVISSALSCCSKNLKQWMDKCYSSVLFGKQRKINPQSTKQANPKDVKRRESRAVRGSILTLLFMCFFLLPLSLPYVNSVRQEGCLLPLAVLTLVLGPSFVLFMQAFSFLCLLATAILHSFFLF